jgi:hypothetical protein
MTTLLDMLDKHIFSGLPSKAAWELIKTAWEKANEKSWEELYYEAFQLALVEERPRLARYADGDIGLDKDTLHRVLHQDLLAPVNAMSVTDLAGEEFIEKLSAALCERQALMIGGHNLTEADYGQLTRNLVRQATSLFKQSVLKNEPAFRKAMLAEVMDNQILVQEVQTYLSVNFDLVLGRLESIQTDLQAIKQYLGLDRPQTVIVGEIRAALDAAPRGPMFEPGGLCGGYLLKPMPDRYFVAQEFSPDRDDLRGALATALAEFGVQPVCADDLYWPGPILCKISALIQGTPFGVYQLTVSQNRNVFLELGIAMGLGRPFVLVKDKGADVSPLAQGFEYYPIDSYLELRYELGEKVRPFLADVANYRPQALPLAGSQRTAVIAHGDLDVIDFCVPVAKMIADHDLTPVILGDSTGRLARYLKLEGVSHHIIGSTGRTRLDETVDAIQAARLGVYRVEKAGAPDTFLALGISMGLNRPGFLIHKSNVDPPSDVKGLSALDFTSYTGLKQSFPEQFGHLLRW